VANRAALGRNRGAALRLPFGDQRGTREAAELLQKMLKLGLSRYEPSAVDAIAEAERATAL
jgi:hypothetical protein